MFILKRISQGQLSWQTWTEMWQKILKQIQRSNIDINL